MKNIIIPKFNLVRPFKADVRLEEEVLFRLTESQKMIIDNIRKRRKKAYTKGYAGTGKTVIASLIFKDLVSQNRKTLFLCYNKNLADFLRIHLDNQ